MTDTILEGIYRNKSLTIMNENSCYYTNSDGKFCPWPTDKNSAFCYWHNDKAIKSGPEVKEKLEILAREGKPMEGFSLQKANLAGIHLEHIEDTKTVNLLYADLNHANLKGAHLFEVNLSHANLLKADLSGANLNFSNLSGANLLGTKFSEAKMENIHWGKKLQQELAAKKALKEGDIKKSNNLYIESEEVYRSLFRECEERGLYTEAGVFFQKEMRMRRQQMPKFSLARIFSFIVDLTSGYGESPVRVICASLLMILLCAAFYFLYGLETGNEIIKFSYNSSFNENMDQLFNCIYFSVITFTTLGYGDITPVGISRLFAATEAFCGAFTMALFVVVFVKKMTR